MANVLANSVIVMFMPRVTCYMLLSDLMVSISFLLLGRQCTVYLSGIYFYHRKQLLAADGNVLFLKTKLNGQSKAKDLQNWFSVACPCKWPVKLSSFDKFYICLKTNLLPIVLYKQEPIQYLSCTSTEAGRHKTKAFITCTFGKFKGVPFFFIKRKQHHSSHGTLLIILFRLVTWLLLSGCSVEVWWKTGGPFHSLCINKCWHKQLCLLLKITGIPCEVFWYVLCCASL